MEEVYAPAYWPGDTVGDHLEFALKYDGTNLAILASVFAKVKHEDLVAHIHSRPTGKYARRLWFLFEFITGERLPIEDLTQGNYIDLLEQAKYYTSADSHRVRRQRINYNLCGDSRFCPMIRQTDTLRSFNERELINRCQDLISGYSPEQLMRAVRYLYRKETRSSFEIEHIRPSSDRTERFVALLRSAEQEDFCTRERLIELQNRIVDDRFKDADFRRNQNYVGQIVALHREIIHYISPKPEDLEDLMEGLFSTHRRMRFGYVSPVVHAAVVGYGFVFLHPFEDGNGRIHRFLIHNILARRGFTPEGVMFPISASMLKHQAKYDASLEAFSAHLLPLVDNELDEDGRMTVKNDTALWYRFVDMTAQVEALYHFISETIDVELRGELAFLANCDRAKKAIQEIADVPDRMIDLFIRLVVQNRGRLSNSKRKSHFKDLTEDEVGLMEEAVRTAYDLGKPLEER